MDHSARQLMTTLRSAAVLAAVAVFCVVLQLGGEAAIDSLRYDRSAVINGQVWRLLTGNFIHGTWSHLGMNLAALGLAGFLFGASLTPRRWLIAVLTIAAGVGLGIWLARPAVDYYVGFSGVLHGLFFVGGWMHARRDAWEGYGFMAVIAAKLAWEQWMGALPGSAEWAGGPVLVEAHLYGAITALPLSVYWRWRENHARQPRRGDAGKV